MNDVKIKICFVATEISFINKFFFELAKEISFKHKVILITDTSKAKYNDCTKLEDLGVEIIPLIKRSNAATPLDYLRYVAELRRKINACSPQNIYFLTLELSMFGALISNFISVKKIFFLITGFGPFFLKNNFKTMLFRVINKTAYLFLLFNKSYKFIFQNQDDMNIFINKNIAKKSNSILFNKGLGINTKEFSFILRNEEELTFLFAARLVKSKGFIEFLEAGIRLMDKYPGISIIVAGRVDFENPESISEKTYDILKKSRIKYLGEIQPNKMNDLYKKATIFVLPSYREGFAQGALEAASTGMPLILSNVPGCRECVSNNVNGYLIREKDSNDLISKMEAFILNPKIISPMSIASREIIEQRFSVAHISKEYFSNSY